MKKFLCLLAVMSAAIIGRAQVNKAQIALDENRFDDAAEAIKKAISPEEIEANMAKGKAEKVAHAYNLAGTISMHILNPEILKAAQNMPLDTTKFISALDDAIEYFSLSNKYDITPNKKGQVKPKYRADNHKQLKQLLSYPAFAGQFLYANKDYEGAYKQWNSYLNLPKNPIFSDSERDTIYQDKNYKEVAFYVTFLSYQNLKDNDKVLANVDMVLTDSAHAADAYLMKSQSLLSKKDTANWVLTVKDAIRTLPNSSDYTTTLLSYYTIKNDVKDALATAAELVQTVPNNKNAWYASGCIKLNLAKDYAGARADLQKAIDLDPKFMEANYNFGLTYINEILSKRDELNLDNTHKKNYLKDVETFRSYYRKALPYLEKARELAPDEPRVWANALKNAYFNLRMNDKEKEIDAEINKALGK